MSDEFDIFLKLLMDERDAVNGASKFNKAVDSIQDKVDAANKSLENQNNLLKKWKAELSDLKQKLKVVREGSAEYNELKKQVALTTESIRFQTKAVDEAKTHQQALVGQLNQLEAAEIKTAKAIRMRANVMNKELGDLKEKAGFIDRAAQPLFLAGTAGFAALAMSAKNYIENAGESNEITQRWAANSEKVKAANLQIGKISAEAILPLYEKLGDIVTKAADFADKNPGIIKAALGTSIVAAGLGALGILVSKGITLYADIKMIAVGDMQLVAAKIMSDAANKQLLAAKGGTLSGAGSLIPGGAAGGGAAATTAAAGAAGGGAVAITATATSVAIAATVTNMAMVKLIDKFTLLTAKLTGSGEVALNVGNMVRTAIGLIPGFQLTQTLYQLRESMAITTKYTEAKTKANNEESRSSISATYSISALISRMMGVKASTDATNASLARTPSYLTSIASSIGSFIDRIISKITGKSSNPVHDYTGYAYTGAYNMAQDGKRQFVLSGDATRMAERMVGGQLNQQAVLAGLSQGTTRNININNRSRFSGEYTKEIKRQQDRDLRGMVGEIFSDI